MKMSPFLAALVYSNCSFVQLSLLRRDVWCEYQVHAVPYAPYKMEVLHTDPWIVVYYDVISDREVDYLKDIATPEVSISSTPIPCQYSGQNRIICIIYYYLSAL